MILDEEDLLIMMHKLDELIVEHIQEPNIETSIADNTLTIYVELSSIDSIEPYTKKLDDFWDLNSDIDKSKFDIDVYSSSITITYRNN